MSLGGVCAIGQVSPYAWAGNPGASATTEELDVLTAGADPTGQSDSSAAFRRAIAESDRVFVPAGRFLIGDVVLRSGLRLRGLGRQSVIAPRRGSRYLLWCDSGSPASADNIQDIRLSGLQLCGQAESQGFSEHQHLLNVNGVTRCRVEAVVFTAFQGDAIYLGSSNQGATERHNHEVQILACWFDGVNHQNRNAISVIDCDGLRVEGCRFQRVARPDMPGAIDLEPDANAFHVVRNVRIDNNRFTDIGGNVGVVSLVVPARMDKPAETIVVTRNEVRGARRAAFCLLQRGNVDPASRARALEVSGNTVFAGAERPFHIEGVHRTLIADNRFVSCQRSALIGYAAPALSVTELTMIGNRFERCGWQDTAALRVHDLLGGRFERNQWIDCGNAGPTASAVELAEGQSDALDFQDNTFSAPHGLSRYAIRRAQTHRGGAADGRFRGNRVDDRLLNQFRDAGTS